MSENFTTDDFIYQLRTSKDRDERLYAAFKIGRDKQHPDVIPTLVAASTDAEYEVRARVAEALGTREDLAAMPTLLTMLKDAHPVVRRTAADSLGNLGSAEAVPALCDAIKDEDVTVRSHSAEALGLIASDSAAEPLVDAFLHDEDSNVRYFARQSLGQVGHAAVDALMKAMQSTDEAPLLIEICEILGNLADERTRDALTDLTEHTDDDVSEMAQWALKRIR
ncbi:MAG: HEAT repeat domain-containing protein [Chloroflexota bacterium]